MSTPNRARARRRRRRDREQERTARALATMGMLSPPELKAWSTRWSVGRWKGLSTVTVGGVEVGKIDPAQNIQTMEDFVDLFGSPEVQHALVHGVADRVDATPVGKYATAPVELAADGAHRLMAHLTGDEDE